MSRATTAPALSPPHPGGGDTDQVSGWGVDTPVPTPLITLIVIGVLMLLLRWAFGRGKSLVARRPQQGRRDQYGLLVSVAAPATFAEAEILRRRLTDAGIRATLAPTTEGPSVMVFPEDADRARAILGGG